MKAALIGFVSAVLVGLTLFATETVYSEYRRENSMVLEFRQSLFSPPLKKSAAAAAVEATETGLVYAVSIDIRNAGIEPIAGGEVRIFGRWKDKRAKILTAYSVSAPANDSERAQFDISSDGVANIQYEVLNPGEEHSIILIADNPVDVSLSSNVPGLTIVDRFFLDDPEEPFDWWPWLISLASILAGILASLFVAGQVKSASEEEKDA